MFNVRIYLDSWPLAVGDTSYRNQFLQACAKLVILFQIYFLPLGIILRSESKGQGVNLTKKERRAVVIAGLKFYLPYLLIMLAGFTVAILLVYLWIS